jgi:hypothetical protein
MDAFDDTEAALGAAFFLILTEYLNIPSFCLFCWHDS